MSLYIYIYLILLLGFLMTTGKKRIYDYNGRLYYILFLVLSILLLLRYGQGTDYMNYKVIYNRIYEQIYYPESFDKVIHGEIGWQLLNQLFIRLGIKFQYLVMFVSAIELWMLHRFVSRYCQEFRCAALLLLYPMFYLTYMFSILRQGLVMCIFLGCMLPLLEKKKYVFYIIMTVLCCTIHVSAILYFIFLFIRPIKTSYLEWLCVGALIVGLMISYGGQGASFRNFFPGMIAVYMQNIRISWFALGEKIIMTIMIAYMMHHMNRDSQILRLLYKIYLVGTSMYLLGCWIPFIVGRLFFLWKFVEVVIIIHYIQDKEKIRQLIICAVLLLNGIMFFKNINGYIMEGRYKENVKIWNYPYINVFDKDKVDDYRNGDFQGGEYEDK